LATLWGVFAATHIGLATRRTRSALVARLGEQGFLAGFSLLASILFALLVHFYAIHRFEGAPGPGLGTTEPVRAVLVGALVVGLVLAFAAFPAYPGSTYATGGTGTRAPRGLERITRHPFFVGVAIAAAAHALLATRLVGTVFSLGLLGLSLVGA